MPPFEHTGGLGFCDQMGHTSFYSLNRYMPDVLERSMSWRSITKAMPSKISLPVFCKTIPLRVVHIPAIANMTYLSFKEGIPETCQCMTADGRLA